MDHNANSAFIPGFEIPPNLSNSSDIARVVLELLLRRALGVEDRISKWILLSASRIMCSQSFVPVDGNLLELLAATVTGFKLVQCNVEPSSMNQSDCRMQAQLMHTLSEKVPLEKQVNPPPLLVHTEMQTVLPPALVNVDMQTLPPLLWNKRVQTVSPVLIHKEMQTLLLRVFKHDKESQTSFLDQKIAVDSVRDGTNGNAFVSYGIPDMIDSGNDMIPKTSCTLTFPENTKQETNSAMKLNFEKKDENESVVKLISKVTDETGAAMECITGYKKENNSYMNFLCDTDIETLLLRSSSSVGEQKKMACEKHTVNDLKDGLAVRKGVFAEFTNGWSVQDLVKISNFNISNMYNMHNKKEGTFSIISNDSDSCDFENNSASELSMGQVKLFHGRVLIGKTSFLLPANIPLVANPEFLEMGMIIDPRFTTGDVN